MKTQNQLRRHRTKKLDDVPLVEVEVVECSTIFNFEEQYDKYPEENDPPDYGQHNTPCFQFKMPRNPYLCKGRLSRVSAKKI